MSESRERPRITTDTNLIVSAQITTTGPPAQVLDAWTTGQAALVSSEDLVTEVSDVLTRESMQRRYRFSPERVERLLHALGTSTHPPLPEQDLPVHCRDPKDDKILACALGGHAEYLVTGDDDLLSLDGRPELGALRIVTPRQFLNILDERGDKPDH